MSDAGPATACFIATFSQLPSALIFKNDIIRLSYSNSCHIIDCIMRDIPILPGEYSNWKDTGCELHPKCLECPLSRCMEEKTRGRQQTRLNRRSLAMMKMRKNGNGVHAVAMTFGVSVRTVQRSVKKRRRFLQFPSS